jgi:PAS domain S-box-containing protein
MPNIKALDPQAHLAAIIKSSDDAIVSKDLTGRILSWNPAAERIFGYTADEAIGQSIQIIIPDDRRAEELEVLAKVSSGEGVDHYETVRRRKDGTLIDISLTFLQSGIPRGRSSEHRKSLGTLRKKSDSQRPCIPSSCGSAHSRRRQTGSRISSSPRSPMS